jgi:adenine-specific DNA-methyltransferase
MHLTDYHSKYFAYELTKRCPSDSVEKLASAVAGAQVVCSAFGGRREGYPSLTVKNIPKAILGRCEWGKDDYSLAVKALPEASPEPGQQELAL